MIVDIQNIKDDFKSFFLDMQDGIKSSINFNEEKLKIETEKRILSFLNKHGIDLTSKVQYEASSIGNTTKITGRIDALYGNVVIEYKKYGILNKKSNLTKGINQLREQYLNKLQDKIKPKFIGILFDGVNIIFIKFNKNISDWEERQEIFNQDNLYEWILYITGSSKKQVTPQLLKNDFSLNQNYVTKFIHQLYNKLTTSKNDRVNMLYNEWDKTFRYIYGGVLDELNIKDIFSDLFNDDMLNNKDIKIDKLLFIVYTYYSFIVKLFASEIACVNIKIAPETPIKLIRESDDILESLRYIEDGNFFRDITNIDNYIEGGFFSWYLEVLDTDLENSINEILSIVNEYEPNSFFIEEQTSRDLLKSLYEDIVPLKIRHDLGEYYTPDWLAQLAVDDSGFIGDKDSKVLDPACGSGAFIVEFINRIKSYLLNTNLNNSQTIDYICSRVIGFDVNPVAILTARTNYLIAISPYINFGSNQAITIPIYLADSIITPTTESKGKIENNSYKISTVEGEFSIPKSLLDKNLLGNILRMVEQTIYESYPLSDFNKRIKNEGIILDDFEQDEIDIFYTKITELHKVNKNQIWAKIILNSFAPLLFNDFSHVIGNPPWIKWDFLSKEYRNKLSILYLDIYKLFSHKGMKASLGYAHDDISILFTYIAMDKYLRTNGKLTFVLKQTLYKSVAGEQFRRFAIEKTNQSTPVKCLGVHDLLKLNPFGQGQETSIVTLEKNNTNKYPVPYYQWNKNVRSRFKHSDMGSYVKENCSITNLDAYPDPMTGIHTAPWIIIPNGQPLPHISKNKSFYKARHGVVNDLNSVFLLDILNKTQDGIKIKNLGDKGKKKTKTITKNIETDLIYPLIKPRDTKKWGITTYQYMIVPQIKAGDNNESELRTELPQSYSFLKSFETEFGTRKSKWFYGGDKPFYSLFGIGTYTFQKFKIVWCCMSYQPNFSVVSDIEDEFIGKKTFIPDNTIGYISVDNANEAYYICSILNSNKIKALFSLRSSKSKWGISIEMVNNVPIIEFDKTNKFHVELFKLSKKAHNSINEKQLVTLENKMNLIIDSHEILND